MEHRPVTRVEVIDENWRSYTKWDCKNVYLDYQDNYQTLKIFINKNIWENATDVIPPMKT